MDHRVIRTAVVTGSTGAIGIALCHRLVEQGIAVYAIIRPTCERAAHLRDIVGVKIFECDISHLSTLPELFPAADAFFTSLGQRPPGPDGMICPPRSTISSIP